MSSSETGISKRDVFDRSSRRAHGNSRLTIASNMSVSRVSTATAAHATDGRLERMAYSDITNSVFNYCHRMICVSHDGKRCRR